ncbi:hypothetical protein NUSPORA_02150 [Nucleospora cyclopteri]
MLSKFFSPQKNSKDSIPVKYFDYQATTPVDSRVIQKMMPFLTDIFGNPSSRNHSFGWEAEKGLEKGRSQVAELINADPKEIIFTSGATESVNLALKGVSEYNDYKLHIITLQTEHKCVLETCRYLEDKGVNVTYLPVKANGQVDLEKLKEAIKEDTKVISISAVNNEIGVKSNLEEIGKICKEKNIIFHVDASQAYGKLPIDVKKCNIGLMSFSGHKMYAPKGIGALYVRRNPRVRLVKQNHGGDQERGLRAGTVPAFLIVGMGEAAEIAKNEMKQENDRLNKLNKKFMETLEEKLGTDFIKNGEDTIPGCINISFPFVEGEGLLMKLKNYALASGSACTSASLEPSYVLRALGTSDDLAHSSIRFGFGRFTELKDVENLAKDTAKAVSELREMSPLYEMSKAGIDLSTIKWTA